MSSTMLTAIAQPIIGITLLVVATTLLGVRLRRAKPARRRAIEAEAVARDPLRSDLIHPHFLLNVLGVLRATLDRQPTEARALLDDLTELLHATLRLNPDTPITVANELQLVRHYLRLQQQRFGAQLTTRVVADDPCLDVPLPPFSLLTLVENAISHGGVDARRGRHVSITLRSQSSSITVEIRNLAAQCTPERHHTGLGLAMVGDRLRRWDARAEGPTLTRAAEWITCTLTLPRRRSAPAVDTRTRSTTDWAIG